ncbi:helix-turn-helix transcriptional regulator [Microbacterium sp. NPDC076768]|uniref:helix-turn-helix transcriptional regulator n=1 Tax=Microbacterium sp. NPDC076768 TaxID=3154858 RepID=UPI003419EB26
MDTGQSFSKHVRLGNFLRARREQARPEDLGLPASVRRRTPGLRREEVAVLANVGVSWYTWVEQGRAAGVSAEVLGSIEDALRLSPEDRTHIRRLAAGHRSPDRSGDSASEQPVAIDSERLDLLQRLVDATPNPSYIVDPLWTVVVINPAAVSVFDACVGASFLHNFFIDPEHVRQEMVARSLVAQFRAQSARFIDDPRFEIMARGLCEVSELFRELWQSQVVGDSYHVAVVCQHPLLGRLSFDPMVLEVLNFPALRLFIYLPQDGADTERSALGQPDSSRHSDS